MSIPFPVKPTSKTFAELVTLVQEHQQPTPSHNDSISTLESSTQRNPFQSLSPSCENLKNTVSMVNHSTRCCVIASYVVAKIRSYSAGSLQQRISLMLKLCRQQKPWKLQNVNQRNYNIQQLTHLYTPSLVVTIQISLHQALCPKQVMAPPSLAIVVEGNTLHQPVNSVKLPVTTAVKLDTLSKSATPKLETPDTTPLTPTVLSIRFMWRPLSMIHICFRNHHYLCDFELIFQPKGEECSKVNFCVN